jgi:hypothetical protein
MTTNPTPDRPWWDHPPIAQPVAEDREFYDSLRDTIPSDVPDSVWESDGLSKGAGE